jgi:catechol 2,3-dioxygenase-like lactoylglutathione lyase family enzyme
MKMTVATNGIAHIQLSVSNPDACVPFWEKLCHFIEMETLLRDESTVYCIGSRTGILVRGAPEEKRGMAFDQNTSGLHHVCFRARSCEDVDTIFEFVSSELRAKIIHPPEDGSQFAPGYYSFLFEDPDGIRIEFNHVPGKGHFGNKGRLGPDGQGPGNSYGSDGILDK